MKGETVIAHDGKKLACTLWDNVRQPVGVVQIIHAANENVQQYDRFAKHLNKHGYIVFGDDYHAHTQTAVSQPVSDPFSTTVADELEIIKHLKNKYELPLFLFGHSYGGFITQAIMEKTDLCTAGVCLSGAAKHPNTILAVARGAAWVGKKLWGENAPARLIDFFSPLHSAPASNANEQHFSYNFYFSLFKNLMRMHGNSCPTTPLLIISGSRDLVNMNSRLSLALFREYQSHDLQNLTIIIYPAARHELLMAQNYKEVQEDVVDFFDSITHAQ